MYKISALNGDGWSTPESTMEGLWSALGAGAKSLTLNVFLTADNKVICAPSNQLIDYTGEDLVVEESTLASVQKLDAGATWCSTILNDGQATGNTGTDTPWIAPNQRQRLLYPELNLVLQTFSRRAGIQIKLNDNPEVVNHLIPILERFKLSSNCSVVANKTQIATIKQSSNIQCYLDITEYSDEDLTDELIQDDYAFEFYMLYEQIERLTNNLRTKLSQAIEKSRRSLYITSVEMPYCLRQSSFQKLQGWDFVDITLVFKGVLPSIELVTSPGIIFFDDFTGHSINSTQWATGYSHDNPDTEISIDDELIIDIKQGGQYSGGAAVMKIPTHGDFDAQVEFNVSHPHQGTTFELAAISINPSYKKTNLTFDVHGAPPYASSERDENDGFRCGWNNSLSVTNFILSSEDIKKADQSSRDYNLWGEPYSSNLYNCYGRDVGYGKSDSPGGHIRLIRHGDIFNSYYRDKFNESWVCSGSMLVTNLSADVFLRLAAKHWKKKNPEPPHNKVTFKHFLLKQY